MAISITSVSPNAGSTGGRYLVTITGDGFRLPTPPAALGPTVPAPPSVQVSFGGTSAIRVDVLSSRRLVVLAPPMPAGVHAVTVTNVSDSGVVLESASAAASFTAALPDYTAPSVLSDVVRNVIRAFRREVLENTVMSVHVDYDDDTSDGLNTRAVAKLPVVVLTGPRLVTDRAYATNQLIDRSDAYDATLTHRSAEGVTVSLEFRVLVAADSTAVLLALMNSVALFFARNIRLTVGATSYELHRPFADAFAPDIKGNDDAILQASTAFVVRGVNLQDVSSDVQLLKKVERLTVGSTPLGPVGQGDTSNPVGDPYQTTDVDYEGL